MVGRNGKQRQRHPNLSSPPRDPLLGVGHAQYLFLSFEGHFGGSRYPMAPSPQAPAAGRRSVWFQGNDLLWSL
jgi:hypothetical protein